jgi:hypothetical protein
MNEQEWLACTAPEKMLQFLSANSANRKFRLFICACCRCYWDRLKDKRSRHAVEWSEQFIEGQVDEGKRREIILAAWEVLRPYRGRNRPIEAWWAAFAPCDRFLDRDGEWQGGDHQQRIVMSVLLRDIIGPLLFRPVNLAPSWLNWHDGLLVSMARQMYHNRDFTEMPILADALEEAGCQDQDILDHCRARSEHVRGCWVVDLVLGKS